MTLSFNDMIKKKHWIGTVRHLGPCLYLFAFGSRACKQVQQGYQFLIPYLRPPTKCVVKAQSSSKLRNMSFLSRSTFTQLYIYIINWNVPNLLSNLYLTVEYWLVAYKEYNFAGYALRGIILHVITGARALVGIERRAL